MTVVSDTTTMVVGSTDGILTPRYASYAWQPFDNPFPTDGSIVPDLMPPNVAWDQSLDHTFSAEAHWIWGSYRVVNPIPGDVVKFEKTFNIPGNPTAGTLYITVDNGFEVSLNGTYVGRAELQDDWETAPNRGQDYVHGSSDPDQANLWQTVEDYNVSAWLLGDNATNTLHVYGVNEYMGPLDVIDAGPPELLEAEGTIVINPAGLIFEIEIDYQPGEVQEVPGIMLEKTVYAGHNDGAGCPGSDVLVGALGDLITYCFTVTNTGGTHLNNITIDDGDLLIDETDLTLVLAESDPLAPGHSIYYYYEDNIEGNLLNIAETEGNPCDEFDVDITELENVTDEDPAAVGVCETPCGACKGQVTWLNLRNNGPDANIEVTAHGKGKAEPTVYDDFVLAGGEFAFTGVGKNEKLGPDIKIWVEGVHEETIHTSCSQSIGPGLIAGDFEVLAGESADGGPLCPLP